MVRKNLAAASWFNRYAKIFAFLVIISGGSFPVLCLVSSNIFGLEFFTTGLTKIDLNKLTKIKVFSTIFLENCPQLAIQVYYSVLKNNYTDSDILLAFSASLLSVIATVLGWWISRDTGFTGVYVNYYLTFQQIHDNKNKRLSAINGIELSKHANLSDEDEKMIKKHRWKRYALTTKLTKVLQIPFTSLEIGNVFLTDEGCILHVIQTVFKEDIKELNIGNIKLNKYEKRAKGALLVKSLYANNASVINKTFIEHFEVTNNLFEVKWSLKYPKSLGHARTKSKRADLLNHSIFQSMNPNNDDNDEINLDNINLDYINNTDDIRHSLMIINKYFKHKYTNNNTDKNEYQRLLNTFNNDKLKKMVF